MNIRPFSAWTSPTSGYRPARTAFAATRPPIAERVKLGLTWATMTVSFAVIVYAIVALPGLMD